MALSYYATTRPGALAAAMNSSTTSVPLVSAATFPDPAGPGNGQYTIIIGYGSDREEVCTVTAKVGDTLTVIRGQDSTAATGKNQGDVVVHGVSARDFKSFSQVGDQPTAHAASHAAGGIDPVTPAAIGAVTPAQLAAALPLGAIIMWSGATAPTNWALCNGLNGTPNLTDRFIVGAGGAYAPGATGGVAQAPLTAAELPAHSHVISSGPLNPIGDHEGGSGTAIRSAFTRSGADTLGSAWTATPSGAPSPTHENRPPYYALSYIMKIA